MKKLSFVFVLLLLAACASTSSNKPNLSVEESFCNAKGPITVMGNGYTYVTTDETTCGPAQPYLYQFNFQPYPYYYPVYGDYVGEIHSSGGHGGGHGR